MNWDISVINSLSNPRNEIYTLISCRFLTSLSNVKPMIYGIFENLMGKSFFSKHCFGIKLG